MKKYDSIYYWQNYLCKQDEMYIKPNAYVLKFSLINTYSKDVFCNWYSFKSYEALIGFIRYVVVPSSYITKVFGKEQETIFIDALNEEDTIELIEDSDIKNKLDVILEINQEYNLLKSLKNNFTVDKMKRYINLVNINNSIKNNIFSNLEFFENVNVIGRELVKEFEADNMLSDLESHMSLNKKQIIDMFDGIDKNPFMLKKLNTYLTNTLVF
ncbi:hypothetical protein [Clostridium celatum]|uniref:hypothetical protein n=1 Tax=Clostridium celatum TaxID=36834 RepID=UPI00034A839F|nr:hypothetical protein [Clostridium celatum]MCE9656324.1 hypothetical protein [Clostridium celatum]MDU3722991.1 hypothetical protein [Clostridium celatum]MDU6297253.1 hypothetical protein [Clostridium celatum]MDY3360744.1 hypothetical protein [Clostridium celatum]